MLYRQMRMLFLLAVLALMLAAVGMAAPLPEHDQREVHMPRDKRQLKKITSTTPACVHTGLFTEC